MSTAVARLATALSLIAMAACTGPTPTPTVTPSAQRSFKPLAYDSVVMLIGDLSDDGPPTPWLATLKSRIDVAARSGVNVIVLNLSTTSVQSSFQEVDLLLTEAARNGISVVADVKVNSATASEYIKAPSVPNQEPLPDYTNQAQLRSATELLKRAIRHLENFPNVVAYKIEWGHYNESWINSPLWDSPSSKGAFLKYLHSLSTEFKSVDQAKIADWAIGDGMYYGPCLPAGDVRRDPVKVAEFNWYQSWRNEASRQITWQFRSAAKSLTTKPIVGFSYVVAGNGTIGYTYTADRYLDAAFSDWAPKPDTYQTDFIRDAYFPGLHLGELDFDTPYVSLARAEPSVKAMYARGIIPQIFYPQWSTALTDEDIPRLVAYINKYKEIGKTVGRAQVLVVYGHNDVGLSSLSDVTPLAALGGAPLVADQPPGLLSAMVSSGITVDVANPDVYTPALGSQYKVVLVVVPRDTVDHEFQDLLSKTSTNVIIAEPSLLFGTPTKSSPTLVTSAFCGRWNPLVLDGRTARTQVYGGMPYAQVGFQGPLAKFGTLTNYQPNHLFAYYDGSFDEVYATAHFAKVSFPTIARIKNIVLFGLDSHVADAGQRSTIQAAFLSIVQSMGVKPG